MRAVRRKDTAPEMAVRRELHRAGFRYRLHDAKLPGTPDLVLPKFRTVIMVYGCFWHAHRCRHGSAKSQVNSRWWAQKLSANRARDRRKRSELRALGWNVVEVWECQIDRETWLNRVIAELKRYS